MKSAVTLQVTDEGKLQVSVDGEKKGNVTYAMVNNSPYAKRSITLNILDPETKCEETIVFSYIHE